MFALDLAERGNLDGVIPPNSEKQTSVLDAAMRYPSKAFTNQGVDLMEEGDRVLDNKRRVWPVPLPGGTTRRHYAASRSRKASTTCFGNCE
jgi:hypothetical protein